MDFVILFFFKEFPAFLAIAGVSYSPRLHFLFTWVSSSKRENAKLIAAETDVGRSGVAHSKGGGCGINDISPEKIHS